MRNQASTVNVGFNSYYNILHVHTSNFINTLLKKVCFEKKKQDKDNKNGCLARESVQWVKISGGNSGIIGNTDTKVK